MAATPICLVFGGLKRKVIKNPELTEVEEAIEQEKHERLRREYKRHGIDYVL